MIAKNIFLTFLFSCSLVAVARTNCLAFPFQDSYEEERAMLKDELKEELREEIKEELKAELREEILQGLVIELLKELKGETTEKIGEKTSNSAKGSDWQSDPKMSQLLNPVDKIAQENVVAIADGYRKGIEQPLDFAKSFSLFESAAEQGNPDGIAGLGEMYEQGLGTRRSYEKALELYTQAAEANSARGHRGLGSLYLYGRGVEPSRDKAEKHLLTAAKDEYIPAYTLLAQLYLGDMLANPVDLDKGMEWLNKAAEAKAPEAFWFLGEFHMANFNAQTAEDFYQKGAELEFPMAQLALGQFGKRHRTTVRKGVRWLEKATKQGSLEAQFVLGSYQLGVANQGEDNDFNMKRANEARLMIQKAALKGHAEAQFFQSLISDEPILWLRKAAAQNHADAQIQLGKLIFEDESKGDSRKDEAIELFTSAKELGHREAEAWIRLVSGDFELPEDTIKPELMGGQAGDESEEKKGDGKKKGSGKNNTKKD